MAAIDAESSVVVAAPTGAGKTVIAEHAVQRVLASGGRLFYTTPIKALSNQKFRDLVTQHGQQAVGLLTGDIAIRRDAPIVVMTTEVLRNMIYSNPEELHDLAWVVLDEIHYLSDPHRGPVWEEVIIHLPAHVRIVGLSATISNHAELTDWIRSVRGPTEVIVETERPIELEHRYAVAGTRHDPIELSPLLRNGRFDKSNKRFDTSRGGGERKKRRWRAPRRDELVEALMQHDLLPTIVFIFSRARCDEAAERLHIDGFRLTDSAAAEQIERIAQRSCRELSPSERATLGYDGWLMRLRAGIAEHHAGMVPAMKEAVEETFAAGLTQVVFATETLALGINMPARSVVVENLSKYNGETHELLTAGQYAQLSGRAGRRGMDEKGVSIVEWSPFVKSQEVGDLAATTEYPLVSAFVPTYNMVANLIDRHDRTETERLLGSSFAQFQADREAVALNRRIDRARLEVQRLAKSQPETLDRPVRPGDVVADDAEPLLVVATSTRKGGRVVLRAVDRFGRDHDLHGDKGAFGALGELAGGSDVRSVASDREALESLLDSFASSTGSATELAQARRRLSRLEARATKREGALVAQLDRVHQVLCMRDFADGWRLTDRGQLLRGLHGDRAIVLAAALSEDVFDGLGAAELAGVVSTLTYHPRSDDAPESWVTNGPASDALGTISIIGRSIAEAETAVGLDQTAGPDAGFFAYTHGWVLGMGFEDLVDDQIGPGEFVRNIRQVGDVLTQIGRSAASGTIGTVAIEAAEALRRGVAAATLTESGALSEFDERDSADQDAGSISNRGTL